MALSCSCDFEREAGDWCWFTPEWFEKMPKLKRRKRCVSCKRFVNPGNEVLIFERYKIPETDIECKIYGEDSRIPLAPQYLCERCGEIYLTLYKIGYECINPQKVLQAQKEYWEMTGFEPEKYR